MKTLGAAIKKYGSIVWQKIWNVLKIAFANKVFRWFFIFMTPIILIFIVIVVVFIHFSPELPSLSQLEQINPKLVTNIYDKDGQIAHEYFVERREWTSIDSIPQKAIQAVMATEDRAFYKHWGMNVWAIPCLVGGESFREESDHAAVGFRIECCIFLRGGELVQLDFREVEHHVELEADLLLRLEDCGNGDGAGNRFTTAIDVLDPGIGNATALECSLQDGFRVVLVEHRLHGNVEVVLLVPSHAHAHATVEVAFGEGLFVIKFDTANRAAIFEFLVELHTLRETCGRNEHEARVLNALAVLLRHVARDAVLNLDNRHFAGFLGVVLFAKYRVLLRGERLLGCDAFW